MDVVRPKILIVDDEPRMCRSIEILLREEGPFETLVANDYYQALEKLKQPINLILTDLSMPGKDGIELLRAIKAQRLELPVVLMTAYSTVESAVTAMKEGAFDYIIKPFSNDQLLAILRKALKSSEASVEQKPKPVFEGRFGDILGNSPVMHDMYFRIQRASETDSTVLITGESGTGKELVAKAIHFSGNRKNKPFIAFNCAAIPENLLESELFGHERGAFSGAVSSREGKFELADSGTLFLDEIGEMAPHLQVKMLRVIQEKSFERVGGKQVIRSDVRIIAATNRDLSKAVENGQFREDLFYRINVITIRVPSLRERKEDLFLLVDHFLAEKSRKAGMPTKKLSPEAQEWLQQQDFPGNVRELENLIERAVVISSHEIIQKRDLLMDRTPSASPWKDVSLPLEKGMSLVEDVHAQLERDVLERALRQYPEKSNSELAQLLGTSRRILESRLKRYQLMKTRPEEKIERND